MTLLKNNTLEHRPIRFASIGECMVEMAPASAQNMFKMGFAGDTLNTAWYVKALAPEWQTRYISRVGKDTASEQMIGMMNDAGIDTAHIGRSADRSVGLYLISLNNGERSFSYWRDQSAARQLADDPDLLWQAVADTDVVYFTGITIAILGVMGRANLLATMTKARDAGKTVVFDSNLRPRLWQDTKAMTDAVMQAAAVSDIVLPSFDDEAVFFGDQSIDATRDRYLNAGATTVIVKNGEGTVSFKHADQSGEVIPPNVQTVVDTTSAGDSFNAGFLVGLAQTGQAGDAIMLGAQTAAQVIGQKGALVPLK